MSDANGQLIDQNFPEMGSKFDSTRDSFSIYQAACVLTSVEPADDGMFRDTDEKWLRLNLDAAGLDPYQNTRSVLHALIKSIDKGDIALLPIRSDAGVIDFNKTIIQRSNLVEWAESLGIEHTLNCTLKSEHSEQPAEIDFRLLATRQQLISAFGKFTSMDMEWFKSLKDSPALLESRRVLGQGGRGHVEPLFCPHAVMLWLIIPKRKKGKDMTKETGWRMLKAHFPNVHALHADYDPNAD